MVYSYGSSVFIAPYILLWLYHNLFIYSNVNEHLGCVQFLAILNDDSM